MMIFWGTFKAGLSLENDDTFPAENLSSLRGIIGISFSDVKFGVYL